MAFITRDMESDYSFYDNSDDNGKSNSVVQKISQPVGPAKVLELYGNRLSTHDRNEILSYKEVPFKLYFTI